MGLRKWRDYLEFIPILIIEKIVLCLPHFITRKLATSVGLLIYLISSSMRDIADKNLAIAFPNLSGTDRKKITKSLFNHFGHTIFEIIKFPLLSKKKLLEQTHFSKNSIETIEKLSKKGDGVIIVSAHYGNWELLALVIASLGYRLNIIIRPLENRLLNQFLNKRRTMFGNLLCDRDEGFSVGLKALKEKGLIAFMTDQNQAKNGIFVPFFGKSASTAQGAAMMSRKTKSPIVATYIRRNQDYCHTVTFEEIVPVHTLDKEQYIYDTTKKIATYFENVIRDVPDQWLWFHNRWKTRPEGEKT